MSSYEDGLVQGFAFALHCLPGRRLEVTAEMLDILDKSGPLGIEWWDDLASQVRTYRIIDRRVVASEVTESHVVTEDE